MCILLMLAGHETTTNLIGNVLLALLTFYWLYYRIVINGSGCTPIVE